VKGGLGEEVEGNELEVLVAIATAQYLCRFSSVHAIYYSRDVAKYVGQCPRVGELRRKIA
jgi:hypothetical protein